MPPSCNRDLRPPAPPALSSRWASTIAFIRHCARPARWSTQGAIGPLLYIRGRYGHGGRLGYEREWRADPAISGGGELLDQGVHLIDLARWFLGDFVEVGGHAATYFWDMPVEDNGFLSLRTASGQVGLAARELHGVEEPVFASRYSAATANCRSTVWAAATASSG